MTGVVTEASDLARDTARETAQARETALQTALHSGTIIEDESEMTPRYRAVLLATMQIAADLEVATLPIDLMPMLAAPSIADRIAVAAALQDEMGHAQVMFRLLDDMGLNTYELLFERDPLDFKSFYLLEFPVEHPIDMAMAQVVGDRAGYTTTADLEKHCSFGPYSRSLRKVNFEEQFHVKRGEHCIRYYMTQGPEVRARVQQSMDFWFPHGAEWFGATDDVKSRMDQLHYRIRGLTNDQLRQQWMAGLIPFCEEVGLEVPAHYDADQGLYVLDYELPILLDEETLTWDFTKVTWEEKIEQWKKGGPAKIPGLTRLQSELWGADLW